MKLNGRAYHDLPDESFILRKSLTVAVKFLLNTKIKIKLHSISLPFLICPSITLIMNSSLRCKFSIL